MAKQSRIPKSKRPAPEMTRRERAQTIGISLQCLSNWERGGVDIWNDDEVKRKISRIRNLPQGIKPEWLPQVTIPDGPIDGSIDGLVAELHACTDKHQAQTIKTKIDGLINAYKLRAAAKQYVSKEVVDETDIRIGVIFKTAISSLENELPPMLHGADMPTMQRIIREKGDEILRSLDGEYQKIYNVGDSDL